MQDGGQRRLVSRMRWSGRILASLAASWFLAVFIGEVVSCDPGPFTWEGATVVAVGLVAIAGALLSWIRERPGAIVLLAASALIGIHIATYAGRHHVLVWLALGFPYLVAGLLLLGSLRLSAPDSKDP
jgi:hypothetical protein